MTGSRNALALAALAAALVAPVPSHSSSRNPIQEPARIGSPFAESPACPRFQARARAASTPAVSGMVVGRDPETGRLGLPTPAQLQRMKSRQVPVLGTASGVEIRHHPGGETEIVVDPSTYENSVVRIDANGRKVFRCVQGDPRKAPPAAAGEDR